MRFEDRNVVAGAEPTLRGHGQEMYIIPEDLGVTQCGERQIASGHAKQGQVGGRIVADHEIPSPAQAPYASRSRLAVLVDGKV